MKVKNVVETLGPLDAKTAYMGHFKRDSVLTDGHNTNWIAGAIKHKGALHRELGIPQGEKIPRGKLEKASHAGGKLGERARLAETLSKMHKK